MSLAFLSTMILIILLTGYCLYGTWVAKHFDLNDQSQTPAHKINDGVDYVPTKPFYLFGQHFSAIAAAGPIAGPILACQQFGWLPAILWIGLGVIFIGAVHDFSSLIASVRHGAKSVAEIMHENLGPRARIAMMLFIWFSLLYVIVAFTDITAGTFVGRVEELQGIKVDFHVGGAVAMASILYLTLALMMGLIQRQFHPPLWLVTLIFVPLTLGMVWLATYFSQTLIFSQTQWGLMILGYCFVASLLPVWLLLQPRGYLGGFVLYLALAIGVIGIFFGGYPILQPAFKTWVAPGMNGSLFPFLFVTIACGACSGFHGLVCSGTTSKQIASEGHCRSVGYGGMLLEALVAFIALSTVMILAPHQVQGAPGTIYGAGMGRFLTLIVGENNLIFAVTFGAMAFSTFVFDTLDVATRLGRYILQELLGTRGWISSVLATLATVGIPAFFILIAKEGGWSLFWILFGTSNQLLAGLTLLGVTVWLYRTKRNYYFTLYPMLFVMGITCWSLFKQIQFAIQTLLQKGFILEISLINGAIAALLLLLAGYISLEAIKRVWVWQKISRP